MPRVGLCCVCRGPSDVSPPSLPFPLPSSFPGPGPVVARVTECVRPSTLPLSRATVCAGGRKVLTITVTLDGNPSTVLSQTQRVRNRTRSVPFIL